MPMENVAERRSEERFITDAGGKKVGVILGYDEYQELIEDLHDLAVIAERRDEKSIPFDEFVTKLRQDGRLLVVHSPIGRPRP